MHFLTTTFEMGEAYEIQKNERHRYQDDVATNKADVINKQRKAIVDRTLLFGYNDTSQSTLDGYELFHINFRKPLMFVVLVGLLT